jgi:hypothetical protein
LQFAVVGLRMAARFSAHFALGEAPLLEEL